MSHTSTTGYSNQSFQFTEEKYQHLLNLLKVKQDHLNLQKFVVTWRMTLHQHLVEESNILSLDMHDGNRLLGVWLKNRDYAGKLKRKAMVTALLQEQHEEDRETWRGKSSQGAPGAPWGPEQVRTFGKQWCRSDYVRFLKPLYPPSIWLQTALGK